MKEAIMGVKVREKIKGSGEWYIFIDYKNKRKAKKIGKDKEVAKKAAKIIEARLTLNDLDIFEKDDIFTPTFKEYVFGYVNNKESYPGWFNSIAKIKLKYSTRQNHKYIITNHLLPYLGTKHLDEISPRLVNDLIYGLFKKGVRSGTVKNIRNCLSSILGHAFKPDGYINCNPVTGILIPTPEGEKPKREPAPFTWKEREYFENIVLKFFPEYYPIVICGFRTGLRIGELLALKHEDFDFLNRIIYVKRNIARGRITTPKSKASIRQVRMTNQVVSILELQRQRQIEVKLKYGWEKVPNWIFFDSNGSFIHYPNFLERFWNKAMRKSKLNRRVPHDMRHSYATLRLSNGDSIAEVSKEMGHSSTDITFKTYYTWLPKESKSDINELDGILSKEEPIATYTQPQECTLISTIQ
jgi:integrase